LFVDEAEITVISGKGGDGAATFRREKYVPRGGPDGGGGGKGGSVYLVVAPHMRTLLDFEYKTKFVAEDGRPGGSSRKTGRSGADLRIGVPPGTLVFDAETGEQVGDLVVVGDELLAARGGEGGRGNKAFATATRQTPGFAERGEKGHSRRLRLELKVLADVGIIGFPSVGKSTFIARVSAARPKIADYPFTTLQPNLGVVELSEDRRMIIADMPGLIGGAHEGVGLGHRFLRHVERTHVLLHMLDIAAVEGRDPLEDFVTINEELRLHNEQVAGLPMIVAMNKVDLPSGRDYAEMYGEELRERGYEALAVSAVTGEGCAELLERVWQMLAQSGGLLALEEDREPRTYTMKPDSEDEIRVTRIQEHVFAVRGTIVSRIMDRTDYETAAGAEWLEEQLAAAGIIKRLEDAGAVEGDTVFLGQVETEYRFALDGL
jgi:GTPase